MSEIRFSEFPEAKEMEGDSIIPIVQNGTNMRIAFQNFAKWIGVSDEKIAESIDKYLEENPLVAGATEEQVKQINENTVGIDTLYKTVSKKEDSGTAESKVSSHNVATDSHNDIRLLIQNLKSAFDAFLDIDDETMNQATEFVAYMKDNRELIGQVTTSKVSVFDIVDNYVTNVSNKPVSAAVAVKLKALIDAIVVPTQLSQLTDDVGFAKQADVSKLSGEITDLKEQGVQQIPLFANSIEECADTSKVYVLPDGYVYAYMKTFTESESYTNFADPTSEEWLSDSRISSSGGTKESTGAIVTNYIPCKAKDMLRVKGLVINDRLPDTNAVIILPTDSSKTYITTFYGTSTYSETEMGIKDIIEETVDATGEIIYSWSVGAFKGGASYVSDNIVYVRLCGTLADGFTAEDVIITINEEITEPESVEEYKWENSGHAFVPADYEDRIIELEKQVTGYTEDIDDLEERVKKIETSEEDSKTDGLPDYWEEYLPDKITAINTLQESGGKDCFSFPLITDIHISANLGKYSGLLMKRIMDACYMKHAICCGDVTTRGANKTKEQMEQSYASAEELLSPVRDKLLQTQGNHDGSYGQEDLDGDGDVEGEEYYCYNFTPQKNHEHIYRKVGLVGDAHFDSTGTGYWIDDVSNKVRYIMLNSHCNKYEENEDGTAVYNNMRVFRLTQSQFDMAIEALTTVHADDWAVLTFSHAPLNDRDGDTFADRIVMRDMLAAYMNKTTYTGAYGTEGNYDHVSVDVDFSEAKGQYVAHFSGHVHADTLTTDFVIPIITTRCDGHEENDSSVEGGLYSERVAGTVTEQSFDVFTINKSERKIYATKIGAGNDREISY